MALPKMTDEQRAEALKKAAETRARRAEVKEQIKAGKLSAKKAFDKVDDNAFLRAVKAAPPPYVPLVFCSP